MVANAEGLGGMVGKAAPDEDLGESFTGAGEGAGDPALIRAALIGRDERVYAPVDEEEAGIDGGAGPEGGRTDAPVE